MNDRHLFRAKRIDNGEWIIGSLVWSDDAEDDYKAIIIPTTDSNMFTKGGARGDLGFENWFRVDQSTICQCTGLKDKNGKMIWENDVLMGHGNPKDLVKAVFGYFYVIDVETLERVDKVVGWHYEVIPTDAISKCEPFCIPMPLTDFYIERGEYEVIGNIFDNPELLEVGE
ncbi:MAG: YopX family protein [Acetivibrio ethanolgignens]